MIYLDNAATSYPKAPTVAKAVFDFLNDVGANAGRSSHKAAQKSSAIMFETREKLAAILGVSDSENISFTLNTTQALNTVMLGFLQAGDSVLTSTMEHNSVMRPLRYLEKNKSVKISQFQCDKLGFPVWDDFLTKIKKRPKLLICTAASNVIGTLFPFPKMATVAKQNKVTFCLDVAQIMGIYPFDLKNYDIDIVCFPGHKGLLGPTGTGGFYCNPKIELVPLTFGGTGSSSNLETQPELRPDKYESGTQNIASLAGLNDALDFLLTTSITKIRKHKVQISSYFIEKLQTIDELRLITSADLQQQVGVLSVTSPQLSLSRLTAELDRNEIATRMGLHCAPGAHKTIGTFEAGGTLRFSPGYFTTKEQIDETAKKLKKIIRKLRYD
jgi:cysteine desulfurase family protein